MTEKHKVALPRDVFMAAIQIEKIEDREAYIQDVYAGDEEKIWLVHMLLAADESMEAVEADSANSSDPQVVETQACANTIQSPSQVGPYKVIEKLGEGGMGDVYMAVQSMPIRRTVALKIIKPGMDSRQVLARFEAERQAVAIMDHPCIARIFDAGQCDSGSPYFVMELVKGKPITEFCNAHKLGLRDRLRLFAKVCRAIQHAHMKGVIHRDLKPANILVELHDIEAVPKVIDFGIAKATGQQLTDRTLQTGFSQLMGTPLYMSPEQAQLSGLDVDTRSDIFSLGVVLFELLTGTTPFERERLRDVSYDEVRRIIQEEDPPRPSRMASTLKADAATTSVATCNQSDVQTYARTLASELDWIVMKCLEKDRNRRYESGSALATDIDRYLNNETVVACPPTFGYRAKKLFRKHRPAIITTALSLTVFFLLSAVSMWQGVVAHRAAAQSEKDKAIAEAVSEFLTEDILAKADPWETSPGEVTLESVINSAADTVELRFQGQPATEAAIRHTLGEAYHGLGRYELSESQFRSTLSLLNSIGETGSERWLKTRYALGGTLAESGDYIQAIDIHRDTLAKQVDLLGEGHSDTLRTWASLAAMMDRVGKPNESAAMYRELIPKLERHLGHTHDLTLNATTNLANTLVHPGKLAEADEMMQRVLQEYQEKYGKRHLQYLNTLKLYAILKMEQSSEQAIALSEEAHQGFENLLGEDHPQTINARVHLANTRKHFGETDAACELYRAALEQYERTGLPVSYAKIQCLNNWGIVAKQEGDLEKSVKLFSRALVANEELLGERHVTSLKIKSNLADNLRLMNRLNESRQLMEELCQEWADVLGEKNPLTLGARKDLATLLVGFLDRPDEARELLVGQIPVFKEVFGNKFEPTGYVLFVASEACWRSGHKQEAIRLTRELMELLEESPEENKDQLSETKAKLDGWLKTLEE